MCPKGPDCRRPKKKGTLGTLSVSVRYKLIAVSIFLGQYKKGEAAMADNADPDSRSIVSGASSAVQSTATSTGEFDHA